MVRASALLVVVGVCGCAADDAEDGPDPPPPTTTCLDEGTAGAVDVLFVIDNSSSLGAATRERLVRALDAFLAPLLASGLDFHVGVVTSDPAEGGVLRAFDGPSVAGCVSCRFLTPAVSCDDVTVSVEGLNVEERDAALGERCEAWLVLAHLLGAGDEGGAFETSFDMAAAALGDGRGAVPAANDGFRRDGAPIHLVFISDEDEGAKRDGTDVYFYERFFEGLAGAGNEALVTSSAIVGLPEDVEAATLAELCPILSTTFDADPSNDDARAAALRERLLASEDGCSVAGAADTFAEIGGRFIELACRTGGAVASLCVEDFSDALSEVAAVVLDRCVDGACIANVSCADAELCDAPSSACVESAECLRDGHCAFGSICEGAACAPGCRRPGDCSRGERCENGACFADCTDTSQCDVGESCTVDGCARDERGPFCAACDADCGGGANFCGTDVDGILFCGVDCSFGQPCPNGYVCDGVVTAPPDVPSCASDDECVRDVCVGEDLANPASPVSGACEVSRQPCFEDFECDVITCVDGGCLIGANCVPAQGLACADIGG